MNSLRKGTVHVLAVILLVSLLGGAIATSISYNFSQPQKLESWLAESKIYDSVVTTALDKAQLSARKTGNISSVSFKNPEVIQAAQEALPTDFLQKSVNEFLDANYSWLEGKQSTPQFSIDISAQKTAFTKSLVEQVFIKLSSTPVCTPAQLAQLQIPVDPLAINCRPANLDPKVEATTVAKEVMTGDFLSKTTYTAQSLSSDKQSKPYYEKLSSAPKLYRLGLQLPWIFTGLALIIMLGILVAAPTRRRAGRRIGYMFLAAGAILIALKFLSGYAAMQVQARVLNDTFSGDLHQPFDTLLHRIAANVTNLNLYFGVAFVVIALTIFGYLLNTRTKQPKAVRKQPVRGSAEHQGDDFEPKSASASKPTGNNPDTIQLAPRRKPVAMDVMSPRPRKPVATVSNPKPKVSGPKKQPKPRRPRLIQ